MEKIADLLTKFMISESSSENLDYEVCKFGLLMAIEVAINTGRILNISDTYKKDVRARYSKLLWDGDV